MTRAQIDFASDYAAPASLADNIALLRKERDRLCRLLDAVERELASALDEERGYSLSRLSGGR